MTGITAPPALHVWPALLAGVVIAWATGVLLTGWLGWPLRRGPTALRATGWLIALPLGLGVHGLGYLLWLTVLGRAWGLWLPVDLLILALARIFHQFFLAPTSAMALLLVGIGVTTLPSSQKQGHRYDRL